jgi:5-hydroxyisourate hydrolase-like protein (transthyretin family)
MTMEKQQKPTRVDPRQIENEKKLRLYLWKMEVDAQKKLTTHQTDHNGRTSN